MPGPMLRNPLYPPLPEGELRKGEGGGMNSSPFAKGGKRGIWGRRSLVAILLVIAFASFGGCVRERAEQTLEADIADAGKGDRAALRALIARFAHPDPDEALRAWEAVVKLGPAAEGELIAALGSSDRAVSEHAAGALGGLRVQAAVDPLVKALGRKDFRRYVAAWALGEIADPKAIPALITALGDEDVEVGKYAVRALTKYGGAAVPPLLEALRSDSPRVRHYAVRALGEIRDKRAAEPLLGMRGRVEDDVLMWGLGRIGDPRGYEILAAAAASPEWQVRLAALQALIDLGDARAVPVFSKALDDGEWIVREWAARGIESVTGERATYRNQHGESVYPYSLYR